MTDVYNVLFICSGNSARSQMAEALLNQIGKGHFAAFSAGSHPSGVVNPFAIEALEHAGFSAVGLRSKSWDEFSAADAPKMDFVFTLCDTAAGESCPVWAGHPTRAHWGIAAPSQDSDDNTQRKVFQSTLTLLKRRIDLFTSLPIDKIESLVLKQKLAEIGQSQ